jgi:hypothetical protein
MVSLKERWWFRPDVNDAQQKAFGKSEPRRALDVRTFLPLCLPL